MIISGRITPPIQMATETQRLISLTRHGSLPSMSTALKNLMTEGRQPITDHTAILRVVGDDFEEAVLQEPIRGPVANAKVRRQWLSIGCSLEGFESAPIAARHIVCREVKHLPSRLTKPQTACGQHNGCRASYRVCLAP